MPTTPAALADIDLWDKDRFVEGVPHEWFTRAPPRGARVLARGRLDFDGPHGGAGPFWCVTGYDEVVAVNRDNADLLVGGAARVHVGPRRGEPRAAADAHAQHGPAAAHPVPAAHQQGLHAADGERARVDDAQADHATSSTASPSGASATSSSTSAPSSPSRSSPTSWASPRRTATSCSTGRNRMIGSDDPEYGVTEEMAQHASMELYAYAAQLAGAEARRAEGRPDQRPDPGLGRRRAAERPRDRPVLPPPLGRRQRDDPKPDLARDGRPPRAPRSAREGPGQPRAAPRDASRRCCAGHHPVMHFRRTAMTDIELGGQQIKDGDKVVIWYISANRDEKVFRRPVHVFDIDAQPERARRVRWRRPALLPRGEPRPDGDQRHVRRDAQPAARHRARRPGPSPSLELHQRPQAHPADVHRRVLRRRSAFGVTTPGWVASGAGRSAPRRTRRDRCPSDPCALVPPLDA